MNSYEIRTNFLRISYEFQVHSHDLTQILPVCTPSFVLTPNIRPPMHPCMHPSHMQQRSEFVLCSHVRFLRTGTAALESEGAACWLEAVFLYGL